MSRPAKPAAAATASPAKAGSRRKHADDLLDEALAETFPASDPVEMLEPAPRDSGKKPGPKAKKKSK